MDGNNQTGRRRTSAGNQSTAGDFREVGGKEEGTRQVIRGEAQRGHRHGYAMCIYMYLYIYVYIYVYICIYAHIYIYICNRLRWPFGQEAA